MKSEEIKALHHAHVMPTYAPGLVLVRGSGSRVTDAEGRDYLDFIAGIATTSVGHCHPRLVEAITAQAGRLMHVSNLYYNELQPRLAEAISTRSLGGKCFFCNSGAEANEGLIKLARLRGHERGRYRIVTLRNSFHGRTLATLTATGQDKVQKGFDPLPDGFDYAALNDLDSIRQAIGPHTAAVLMESIQGEGGICLAETSFMQGVRELCDEHGLLLLCDEVQAGFGRTGNWFGWQTIGVRPDAMSMAKGMGGGFPIGGITASPDLSDVLQPGTHATTFGGTPLACAAALAVIDIIESEGLLQNANERGRQLREGLAEIAKSYDWINGVRGAGLMNGLVLNVPALDLMNRAQEKGLLVLATAHTVIRLVPPLTVSEGEVDRALSILNEACAAIHRTQGVQTS